MSYYSDDYECPKSTIESTFKLISKKWNLQLIHEMFFGKTRFNEFKEDKSELDNKTLARALKDLQENGLIEKRIDAINNTTEYYLTEKGKSLNKVIYEISVFAIDNDSKIPKEDKELIKNNLNKHLNY